MLPPSGQILNHISYHPGQLPRTTCPSAGRSVVGGGGKREQDILESSLWRRWKTASTWQPRPC